MIDIDLVYDIFVKNNYVWKGQENPPTVEELRKHIDGMKSQVDVGEMIISGRLIVMHDTHDAYDVFVMVGEERKP